MIRVLDVSMQPWQSMPEAEREICRQWARAEGLNPDMIFRIELLGEGVFRISEWRVNERGKRYIDPASGRPAFEEFVHEAACVPPWLRR